MGPRRSAICCPRCSAFALLAAFARLAQQAKPWEQIPIPTLHEFHPQQPKRIELKNGIVIFLQEDHELPFISGSVLIPGGSRDEDPAKAGLVGLYGQAWRTSGTAKMDGDAMDDLLEAKAAHIETDGDDDSTALSWDSLKGDADQVFSLAMDLLFHPKFSAEKLQLAQQQEATGIVRRNDDEDGIAEREAPSWSTASTAPTRASRSWPPSAPSRWPTSRPGTTAPLKGKLIVGISGDFDPAAMEAKVRAAFEGLPPVTPEPPRHDQFPGPKPGVYFIDKEDVNQSNVEIVGLGIDRHNPDVPAIAVMNEILGGGFGSRLFQKVRTAAGTGLRGRRRFGLRLRPSGHLPASKCSPRAPRPWTQPRRRSSEIAGLNTTPFTEDELKRAKDDILNSFLFRYDTKDKILAERERLEFYGYPADYLETYQAALEKVTLADVTAAAKKYIHPDKLAVLVVGNGPEIKPAWTRSVWARRKPIDITIPQPPGSPERGGAQQ